MWSWELVQCYDHLDVGWNKLADVKIVDDQLVACSYNQAFCSVWLAEVHKIRPFTDEDNEPQYQAADQPVSDQYQASVQQPVQHVPQSVSATTAETRRAMLRLDWRWTPSYRVPSWRKVGPFHRPDELDRHHSQQRKL